MDANGAEVESEPTLHEGSLGRAEGPAGLTEGAGDERGWRAPGEQARRGAGRRPAHGLQDGRHGPASMRGDWSRNASSHLPTCATTSSTDPAELTTSSRLEMSTDRVIRARSPLKPGSVQARITR